jgi:hypothetical protein
VRVLGRMGGWIVGWSILPEEGVGIGLVVPVVAEKKYMQTTTTTTHHKRVFDTNAKNTIDEFNNLWSQRE